KNEPKLSPASDPSCLPPPAGICGGFRVTGGMMSGQNVAMFQMARVLSTILLRPVIDETHVEGVFNVSLTFSPETRPGEAPRDLDSSAVDPNAASIFAALQEQAGLKLSSQKRQIDILAIEQAERPSEN